MTTAISSFSIFTIAFSLAAQQIPMEARAVAVAQKNPVSLLETGLPKQSLERWLTLVAGPGAQLRWEVTDCGEQPVIPTSTVVATSLSVQTR